MKLLNRTVLYLSGALLIALTTWAVIFYINMLDEVHDSIDDGLANSKLLIMHEAEKDTMVLQQNTFDEGNYAIQRMATAAALRHVDTYVDTLMYMEEEEDLEPVRMLTTTFWAKDGHYYQLKVISSMVEEDDLIEDLFYSLLWLYLIFMVCILFISNVLLRRIWKPFYTILSRLRSFRLGSNEQIETEPTSITEFKMLNETVRDVLESNIKAFNSQKQLIENASHEWQTPLAIALNKLQLFADKHPLTEEQMEELYQVVRALERLTRLNKSLLLLSKIENRQFHNAADVNFNELCRELLDDFSDLAEHKGITVRLQEDAVLVRHFQQDLASILLTNLIKNALTHNAENGVLNIFIEERKLIVENSGQPLALDEKKIFGRFYKGDAGNRSTGLGLAIVQSICEAEGCVIAYRFTGLHRMEITF